MKRRSACLDGERGTIRREAGIHVALGYPAPYRVGASSLGAQTIYRSLNQIPGLACARFFLPDRGERPGPLLTLETGRPVSGAQAIAFSVSCETDLYGVVALLDAAGCEPLRDRRGEGDPPVIIGGPLTMIDPELVAPLADVVVVGEAEEAVPKLGAALVDTGGGRAFAAALADQSSGIWIPSRGAQPPGPFEAPAESLPAFGATWSPVAEFRDLFLVEASRGCMRACAFCILSARAADAGRFRPVPVERILRVIPPSAPGVGLVGAAVTDHPEIEKLVAHIVESGRRVSLSSIRADRLTERLLKTLKAGGLRTLTVAADGASDRLRKSIHKGIESADLIRAAEMAAAQKISGMKIYAMVGLPGEREEDLREFAGLVSELRRRVRVTIALQAFVPKPKTLFAREEMIGIRELEYRIGFIKRAVQGKARLTPTSPRWSWLDSVLVRGGALSAHAALHAYRSGGGFTAWRKAIAEVGLV